MLENSNVLKVISTTDSKLKQLQIQNGQLIFVYDKWQIYMDMNNKRTLYEQIKTIDTETERSNILAPINGFYFIIETGVLWRYSEKWIQITSPPIKYIVYRDSYLNFPTVGNEDQIYIDTTENATYRWDEMNIRYYCIGRDYKNVKVINGGDSV